MGEGTVYEEEVIVPMEFFMALMFVTVMVLAFGIAFIASKAKKRNNNIKTRNFD